VADNGVRAGGDETVVFEDGEIEGEEAAEGVEADAAELGEGDHESPSEEVEGGELKGGGFVEDGRGLEG